MSRVLEFTTKEFIKHFPLRKCIECEELEGSKCRFYDGFRIEEKNRPVRCIHFNQKNL